MDLLMLLGICAVLSAIFAAISAVIAVICYDKWFGWRYKLPTVIAIIFTVIAIGCFIGVACIGIYNAIHPMPLYC